jgi:hypothetical protein
LLISSTLLAVIVLSVLAALAARTGDLPNTASTTTAWTSTAWRGGPGERGYSADGTATPIGEVIRDRDIRTPNEDSAVPLLEQVRRELAKSDPKGAFAGIIRGVRASASLKLLRFELALDRNARHPRRSSRCWARPPGLA